MKAGFNECGFLLFADPPHLPAVARPMYCRCIVGVCGNVWVCVGTVYLRVECV